MDKTRTLLLAMLGVSVAGNLYWIASDRFSVESAKPPASGNPVFYGAAESEGVIPKERAVSTAGIVDSDNTEALQTLFESGRFSEALDGLEMSGISGREQLRTRWLRSCMQWIVDDPHSPRIAAFIEAGLRQDDRDIDFRQLQAEQYIGLGELELAVDLLYELINESDAELQGIFASRISTLFREQVNAYASQQSWQALVDFSERLLWHEPGHPPYVLVHARALAKLGRYVQARSGLLTILHDRQSGREAKALLDNIDRLSTGGGQIKLVRRGLHHIVSATINGEFSANLMIDTGASVSVISRKYLQNLASGTGVKFLRNERVNTAGGPVYAEMYEVESLQLDKFVIYNLEVAVIDLDSPGGTEGLLGMNYLRNFEFSIDQDRNLLTLSPRE